jgi:hypothetical protein
MNHIKDTNNKGHGFIIDTLANYMINIIPWKYILEFVYLSPQLLILKKYNIW